MKNLKTILFLLATILSSCEPEMLEIPNKDTEEIEPKPKPSLVTAPYIEWQAQEPSCIPLVPILIDTSARWRGSDELYEGLAEYGKGKAVVRNNNYDWRCSAAAGKYGDKLSIVLRTFHSPDSPTYQIEEILFVAAVDSERCVRLDAPGIRQYNSTQAYVNYGVSAGDVSVGDYELLESTNNLLEITELDTINHRLSGKFMVALELESGSSTLPDTVRFVNGSFSCELFN